MSDARYVMVSVDGHDPVTVHDAESGYWRLECSCGEVGGLRETANEATEDRFAHEASIGARVEADE